MSNLLFSYYTDDLVPSNLKWGPKDRHLLLKLVSEAVDIDWEEIAKHFPNKNSIDCFMVYRNEIDPSLNKAEWDPKEDTLLSKLAEQHNFHDWHVISQELGTNRTPIACLERYQRVLNKLMINSDEFTAVEDSALVEAVGVYKTNNWQSVSNALCNRSATQCFSRWRKLQCNGDLIKHSTTNSKSNSNTNINSNRISPPNGASISGISGRWTRAEEKRLLLIGLVYELPMNIHLKMPLSLIQRVIQTEDASELNTIINGAGVIAANPTSVEVDYSTVSPDMDELLQTTTASGVNKNISKKRKYLLGHYDTSGVKRNSCNVNANCLERSVEVNASTSISTLQPSTISNTNTISSDMKSVWVQVSKLIPGRTDIQCREKWVNTLDPSINSHPFTPSEDTLLLKLVNYFDASNII